MLAFAECQLVAHRERQGEMGAFQPSRQQSQVFASATAPVVNSFQCSRVPSARRTSTSRKANSRSSMGNGSSIGPGSPPPSVCSSSAGGGASLDASRIRAPVHRSDPGKGDRRADSPRPRPAPAVGWPRWPARHRDADPRVSRYPAGRLRHGKRHRSPCACLIDQQAGAPGRKRNAQYQQQQANEPERQQDQQTGQGPGQTTYSHVVASQNSGPMEK